MAKVVTKDVIKITTTSLHWVFSSCCIVQLLTVMEVSAGEGFRNLQRMLVVNALLQILEGVFH